VANREFELESVVKGEVVVSGQRKRVVDHGSGIDLDRQVIQIVKALSRFSTPQAAPAFSDQERVGYFEFPMPRYHSSVLLN